MRTNDAQMLVLCTLADGPLHGYAINAAIEKLSGERLGPGSLYGALTRLEDKELIEPLAGEGRQRPVRLTAKGREVLERELRSMAEVTDRMFEAAVPDRIGYLDRLAGTDVGRSYKQLVLDALDIRPGHTALDMGCGPGTDLAALAEAVTPSGAVIGIDTDPEMVDRARGRTADRPAVDVRLGDAHDLPLADASVDRARTDRTLQHVTDPAQVLAEARRVLRPGGRLVMAEPDWDSLAVDHPDPEISRAYTRHITDRIVRNAVIGRQLPRLATEAGFAVPTVVPVTSVFRDVRSADRILGFQRNAERAAAAGYFSEEAARRFLDHLAEGPFFAAVTLYVVVAEVGEGPSAEASA
ncbi:methyltransferase domain-containing protein [Streptomyces sp. FXJ1.4098]|uniref:methyltransferase domain-containing protein n=1 Tax=Streptomyces sp. NPDC020845 TaxID=3365096 RepID=UPI00299552F6|nr:methyltransferase domain-containing protein [Streptomyces sp. FXJ1.4098]